MSKSKNITKLKRKTQEINHQMVETDVVEAASSVARKYSGLHHHHHEEDDENSYKIGAAPPE